MRRTTSPRPSPPRSTGASSSSGLARNATVVQPVRVKQEPSDHSGSDSGSVQDLVRPPLGPPPRRRSTGTISVIPKATAKVRTESAPVQGKSRVPHTPPTRSQTKSAPTQFGPATTLLSPGERADRVRDIKDYAVSSTQTVPPRMKRVFDAAGERWLEEEIAYLEGHDLQVQGPAKHRLKEKARSYVRAMMHHYRVANIRRMVTERGVRFPSSGDRAMRSEARQNAEAMQELRDAQPEAYLHRLADEYKQAMRRKMENRAAREADPSQVP